MSLLLGLAGKHVLRGRYHVIELLSWCKLSYTKGSSDQFTTYLVGSVCTRLGAERVYISEIAPKMSHYSLCGRLVM